MTVSSQAELNRPDLDLDSPLVAIRTAFLANVEVERLLRVRTKSAFRDLLKPDSLQRGRHDRFLAWLGGQALLCGTNSHQGTKLLGFAEALRACGNSEGAEGRLEELVGHARELRWLTGLSMMRVNDGVQEIRYQQILSDCLAEQTIRFVEASVRVTLKTGGYSGSVGVATRRRSLCVPNSLLDKSGVVACEDFVGGNSSILMRAVYTDDTATAGPVAVISCFHPLADFFRPWDETACERFYEIVNSNAGAIRTYLDSVRLRDQVKRFGVVLSSAGEKEDVDRRLLNVLVPQDTRQTDLPALVGHVISEHDDNAHNYGTYCCSFFERDESIAESLWQTLTVLPTSTESSLLEVRVASETVKSERLPKLGLIVAALAQGFVAEASGIPELSPSEIAAEEWPPAVEGIKLIGDLARALVDQGSQFLLQSALGQDTSVTEVNVQQILDACRSLPSVSRSLASSNDLVVTELRAAGKALTLDTEAVLCRLGSLQCTVVREIGDLWQTRPIVRLNPSKAAHVLETHAQDLVSAACPYPESIGEPPRLRLYSPRQIAVSDQLLLLTKSCYAVIEADRKRGEEKYEHYLGSYASGQSHTLQNALASPLILLEWNDLTRVSLGSRKAESLRGKAVVPASEMITLAKKLHQVAGELSHTQDQVHLFSWVMDPKNALARIAQRNRAKPSRAIEEIVIPSLIRGALLAVERRLTEPELAAAGRDRDLTKEEVKFLRLTIAHAVECCYRDDRAESRLQALRWLQTAFAPTRLTLETTFLNTATHFRSAAAVLATAMITELSQNAIKAAFRFASGQRGGALSDLAITTAGIGQDVRIGVSNRATSTDIESLRAGLEAARRQEAGVSTGGVKGLWQVQMLGKVGGGSLVDLELPRAIGPDTIAAGIILKQGSAETGVPQ